MVEHDARLDRDRAARLSNSSTWFRCLRHVDHERCADGLAALRGARRRAAARDAGVERDAERRRASSSVSGHDHADGSIW
jgi:hypothetical protein